MSELWLSVSVNSCDHVGTLSPCYGTCSQNVGRHDIQKVLKI